MKTIERVASRHLSILFVLAYTRMTVECLPLFETTTVSPASTWPFVEDLLRLYNISNEDVEASRQKQIALRHSDNVTQQTFPLNSRQQQQPHVHPEEMLPAPTLDAQIIMHQRNR